MRNNRKWRTRRTRRTRKTRWPRRTRRTWGTWWTMRTRRTGRTRKTRWTRSTWSTWRTRKTRWTKRTRRTRGTRRTRRTWRTRRTRRTRRTWRTRKIKVLKCLKKDPWNYKTPAHRCIRGVSCPSWKSAPCGKWTPPPFGLKSWICPCSWIPSVPLSYFQISHSLRHFSKPVLYVFEPFLLFCVKSSYKTLELSWCLISLKVRHVHLGPTMSSKCLRMSYHGKKKDMLTLVTECLKKCLSVLFLLK